MRFPVVIDACALIPYQQCDLLLRMAEQDMFQVLWSDEILEEVRRNLPKLGVPAKNARRRVAAMRDTFPNATVVGYSDLVPSMRCHKKDRHVLAAAVRSGAQVIVTANLKDFPDESLAPYDIEAVHPDSFLLSQLDLYPEITLECLNRQSAAYGNPAMSPLDVLRALRSTAPNFSQMLGTQLVRGETQEIGQVAWSVQTTAEEALLDIFPDADAEPLTPAGVGFLWWSSLMDLPRSADLLHALTYSARAFGDYRWAVEMLDGYSIATRFDAAIDAPDQIAFMRFVPDPGSTIRIVQGGSFSSSAIILTLVLKDDLWKVWGLGPHHPTKREVFG